MGNLQDLCFKYVGCDLCDKVKNVYTKNIKLPLYAVLLSGDMLATK